MSCWLAHNCNLLGMYCYFPVIWLVNFVWSGPDYSSDTVKGYVDNFQKSEMNNLGNWQQVQNFFIQSSKRFLYKR